MFTKNASGLLCAAVTIPNSKTKAKNESIELAIGNNNGNISPLYLIYRWYHWRRSTEKLEKYLFSLSLQEAKKIWKKAIAGMNMLDGKKWRYHGLRKGFATSLQQRKVSQGLIAYAGRWSLVSSFHKYALFTNDELLPLAGIMWNTRRRSLICQDLDEAELEILREVKKKNLLRKLEEMGIN